jgi:crotonobetainyl-CoA:carnitine CoA-transferase CaiB-like acyl-CoA transferase
VRRAPPVLGEHTFEVLREHGYAQGDLEALVRRGVIVQHAAGAEQ